MDHNELMIYWVLPDTMKEYKSKPCNYLMHLFGHEGENSILSYLKKDGLAISLSAGPQHILGILTDFRVTIKLTQKGLDNY
jgi:insulysin